VADVKWIKITTDIFDDEKILLIEAMPSADSIIVIWFKLLALAGKQNNDGVFMMSHRIAYTDEMLANELRRPLTTVRMALNVFQQFGMIEIVDDILLLSAWEKYQSTDRLTEIREYNRIAKQRSRENQKRLQAVNDKSMTSQSCQDTDIEEDKDKRKRNKSVVETTHELFERLSSDYSLSEELKSKMAEWIKYKTERKETYKEQVMKSLLKQVERKASAFGDKAICELIDECMANGWKGIIFERIKNAPAKVESTFETDDFFEAALARSYRGE
jgi:predicted phage replisome organizer